MNYKLFFGTQQHCITPDDLRGITAKQCRTINPTVNALCTALTIEILVTGHQVHGRNGLYIYSHEQASKLPLFTHPADFLITNIPNIGIAVATADCLPVIFYDPVNHAIGIAHAGWRGTVAHIVVRLLAAMHQQFNTQANDVEVTLGPCAHACCYVVDQNFINDLEAQAQKFIISKTNAYSFDMSAYTIHQLTHHGIQQKNINTKTSLCTICDPSYCSYRRLGTAERNLNIAALNTSC